MLQIPLQPLYSLPCQEHKQMTLIARDVSVSPTGPLGTYQFNPITLEFLPVTCHCCKIIPGADDFEFRGTRGIRYTKYHEDVNWNALICIGVTWNAKNRGYGKMEIFVGLDGQIAWYWYNELKRAYVLQKSLDCWMVTNKPKEPVEPYLMDNNITPLGVGNCKTHGQVILSQRIPTGPEDRFLWNALREQFEWIFCDCQITQCQGDTSRDAILIKSKRGCSVFKIMKHGKRIRKIEVEKGVHGGPQRILPSSVVRDLRGKSAQELKAIRDTDTAYAYEKNVECYGTGTSKYWNIFPNVAWMVNEKGEIEPRKASLSSLTNATEYQQRKEFSLGVYQLRRAAMLTRKEVVTDSELSEEFQKYQNELLRVHGKEVKEPPTQKEGTSQTLSDVDSDVDYDEDPETGKFQKPMAPESVITRDADSYSMISGGSEI